MKKLIPLEISTVYGRDSIYRSVNSLLKACFNIPSFLMWFILILVIIFFTSSSLFAEKSKEVNLRFSKQDNLIRIVLESEEELIKYANTISSLSSVRIEFPTNFELKKQMNFIFETFKENRVLIINFRNIFDVKVFKLVSPSRIVIDLKSKQLGATQKPEHEIQQGTGQDIAKTNMTKTLVIDVGHGGYDYGIVSENLKEKDINLKISRDLSNALLKKGYKVLLTRKVDQTLSINDRLKFANKIKPDFFISIHSSLSDKLVINLSTFDNLNVDIAAKLYSLSSRQNRHIEKSRHLSYSIGESIKSELDIDVFMREIPLPILNSIDSPAILIEYPSIKFNEYDQKMNRNLVDSIIKGIEAYEQ